MNVNEIPVKLTKVNIARMEMINLAASVKLNDFDDRLRRVEDSARENKNALSQLISHTKVKTLRGKIRNEDYHGFATSYSVA